MYDEKEILKQFGKNVKTERARLGYSQENLADKMGVTREYLSRIERDIQNMSLAKITELTNVLETDIKNILKF